MKIIKIYINTEDRSCENILMDYFKQHPYIQLCNSNESKDCDIIVSDNFEKLNNDVFIFKVVQEIKETKCPKSKNWLFFPKPFNPTLIEIKALKVFSEKHFSSSKKLQNTLGLLGISPTLSGYNFIKEAIILSSGEYKIQEIYKKIALNNSTTYQNVERCIRYAIERGWLKACYDVAEEIFSYFVDPEKGKPSNEQFIRAVAEFTKLDNLDY